ncbi:DNA repair protein [Panacibacter ginsenosidivorans]|uniref:DNA repair protein n=1 Tax=Panacibacter ginsenosidivorans TaxID=1813871 RepID=A0A5B8VEL6_9BACT|nr:JAB domain-containing protein [Panacibacter ginsenosidivorans]QEC69729.1 DNA repair protein [Panacibacter ginsenosidivorans]
MEQTFSMETLYQVAEIELVYKSKVKASERPKIITSKDAYKILLQTWDEDKMELQEQFKILLLNRGNKVVGIYEVSTGGITGTVADPRLIFTAALKANAVALILAHNHPSASLKPSNADTTLTQKIKEGGKLLDINVMDHLIICNEGYYSFADEGCI